MKKVVFTTGRMNPPTNGHERLFNEAVKLADETGADVKFFVTRSHDDKKNPLPVSEKLAFLKALFPTYSFIETDNAFTACREMAKEGYTDVTMVVGEDRDGAMIEGLKKYIDHPDPTKSVGVKSVDKRVVERPIFAMSASKARKLALDGNYKEFYKCLPDTNQSVARALYKAVRRGLGEDDGD